MDIGAWALFFVLAGQQPIVTFDYTSEEECQTSQKSLMHSHPEAQSWCVPWSRNETKKSRSKWKVVE